MVKQRELIRERLQKVMLSDRHSGLENLLTILKCDLVSLLKNYMVIEAADDLKVVLEIVSENKYKLSLAVETNKLLEPGKLL